MQPFVSLYEHRTHRALLSQAEKNGIFYVNIMKLFIIVTRYRWKRIVEIAFPD